MPDEAGYIGQLVTYEEAAQLLGETEGLVLGIAYNEWLRSIEVDEQTCAAEVQQREEGQQPNSNDDAERT